MSKSLNTKKLSWMNVLKTVLPFAIMLTVVILLRVFVIGSFSIPSASMEPTLKIGDIAVVNYLDKNPQQGDIAVFSDDKQWLSKTGHDKDGEHLIKRVAAVGGDTIESKNNVIYVNGKPWENVYGVGESIDFPLQEVPEGHYFMLGDNREYSADSRYHIESGQQFISQDSIVGRAFFAISMNPFDLRPLHSK